MNKLKVLFLIHTLGGGGAERALVNLVNHMDQNKYDITVETMYGDGVNLNYLMPHIRYVSKKSPSPKGISILLKFISSKRLYNIFVGQEQYDVMVAYMHGAPVKTLAGNRGARRVAWIHNGNPETSTMFENWMLKRNAIRDYADYNRIVGVCESVATAFSKYTGIPNIEVIYNTLDVKRIKEEAHKNVPIVFDDNYINIVSTGRLSKEKGYSRLINVCKKLKDHGYRFRLYIIGAGAEQNSLENQINKDGLSSDVFLLGFQENPYVYVNAYDVFVCSSFTEGLSTATIEALILGKAIVSTDVSGAKEIIGNSEYGILVENSEEGLYEGLKELLSNPEIIAFYKQKALERASVFDTRNTVTAVENLIDEVVNE